MTRLGGTFVLPSGDRLIWSVADGSRGRRWREAVVRDGAASRSLLLETAPDGRWTRLEMATAHGLLTLHPDSDATEVHGNAITTSGIRHLTFAWSPEHALFISGSPACLAAFGPRIAPGEGSVPILRVADDLRPTSDRLDRSALDAALDADGLALPTVGLAWPLEHDDAAARG